MTQDVRNLADLMKELAQKPSPTGHVLTVYLATGFQRSLRKGYVLSLRDGCKALRGSVPADEHRTFEAAVAQVEAYVTETLVLGGPGIAVFASGDPEYFVTATMPSPPTDEVVWDRHPHLGQLQAVLDHYERVAVALFDKERTRLFTIFLGEIESQQSFKDHVPGKQATGGWFALEQTRFARHHEEHVARHAKRTTAALTAMHRSRPFDRLFLGGPDEALSLLHEHLPRPLRDRLAGTLSVELFASDQAVLDAALQAAETAERDAEFAAVTELIEAGRGPHATFGFEDTLAALNDGRAHVLYVSNGLLQTGAQCPNCGRMHAGGTVCPTCGAGLVSADIKEGALRQAMEQGTRIEVVSGQASDLLIKYGGMAAKTRY